MCRIVMAYAKELCLNDLHAIHKLDIIKRYLIKKKREVCVFLSLSVRALNAVIYYLIITFVV